MPTPGHRDVFISGGTGYIGGDLIPKLLQRGHSVRVLARPGSERKVPPGCDVILGNALDAKTFADRLGTADTYVHLVGVSHPAPWKARQFRDVDFRSAIASIEAAVASKIRHFVFVSVAHPAPVMKAYWGVRAECEDRIRAAGLKATVLRPWYVLGPGHRWAYGLIPLYKLFETIPATAATARRCGLLRLDQMVQALLGAVESPVEEVRVVEVDEMRRS